MTKSADAFRTITEVAELLDTPAHVIRFWETRFPQIRPVKRAGGRRYFRPADVALIGGIKVLLHGQGMSIRDAQKLLKEQGVSHVMSLADMDKLFPDTPDQNEPPPPRAAKLPVSRPPLPEAASAQPPTASAAPPTTVILPLKPRRPTVSTREQPSLFDLVHGDAALGPDAARPDANTPKPLETGPQPSPAVPEAPMAVDIPPDAPKPARVIPIAPEVPQSCGVPRSASKGQTLVLALGRIAPASLSPDDRSRLLTAQRRLIALHGRMRAPLPLLG